MDFSRLAYIKNINDDRDWAYKEYPVGAYFPLTFKRGDGVEAHALNLPKGALVILSQSPPTINRRYLTHVIEICNNADEDKPQWASDAWGIIRWAKVCWVANFQDSDKIPVDKHVMQAEWGWFDTKAKLLTGKNLTEKWGDIDKLKTHLQSVFI